MSSSKILKNALKLVYTDRFSLVVSAIAFSLSLLLYIFAILQTGTLETFFIMTPFPLLLAQIILSVGNSVLIAISFTFFIYLYRKQKEHSETTFISVISAIFLSVAATGCYVCGTVLLPFLGVAASFAALPFGGLEVKFLTALLLLYSLNDLTNKVLGICFYESNKIYKVIVGNKQLKIKGSTMSQIKPLLVTLFLVMLIFALPFIIPDSIKKDVSASNSCNHVYQSPL